MAIGHKKQRDFLERLAGKKDKISHAYLFAGQGKIGKKTIAFEWSSLLFGGEMKNNHHPDFIFVEPIKEEKKGENPAIIGKEIKIGQIRELISKLSLRAYSSDLKIAVIDEAHLMNQEAQGALLKTLEEPKGDAVLILVSDHPERLLSTILSRVEMIKFYPVKKEEIKELLKSRGISAKEADEIVEISGGCPGRAIDLAFDPGKLESLKSIIKDLEKLSKSDLAERFQYAKDLSDNKELTKEVLDIWISYFRKNLLDNLKSKEKNSLLRLKKIIKSIQEIKNLILNTNVNSRLALETLMIEI